MYIDKNRAISNGKKNNKLRVPEKILFFICIIGGSLGILIGMHKFRHKTKKIRFSVGTPLLLILNIVVIIYISVNL